MTSVVDFFMYLCSPSNPILKSFPFSLPARPIPAPVPLLRSSELLQNRIANLAEAAFAPPQKETNAVSSGPWQADTCQPDAAPDC